MPPNHFESEVESFLEGSHGDRTHIKRADHHTVTPLCGTLLVGPAGAASGESFVPVEASWRGARDRCELTVGTKGPAARAAGRMDASVSVVLGITGRCPTISHAIPCEHRAGLCQFIMSRHLCFGIACEIGGGLVTGVAGGVLGVHGQRVLGDALAKRMGARAGSEIGHAPAARSGAHRSVSRAPVHI